MRRTRMLRNFINCIFIICLLISLIGCGKLSNDKNKVRLQDDFWYYANVEQNEGNKIVDYYERVGEDYQLTYEIIKELGSKNVDYKVPCSEQVVHDVYNQMLEFVTNKEQSFNDEFKKLVSDILAAEDMKAVSGIIDRLNNYQIYSFLDTYNNLRLSSGYMPGELLLEYESTFLGYNLNDFERYDFIKSELEDYIYKVFFVIGKSETEARNDANAFVDNLYQFAELYQAEDALEFVREQVGKTGLTDSECILEYFDKYFYNDNFYYYKIVLISEMMDAWKYFLAFDYDCLMDELGNMFTSYAKDDYDLAAALTTKYFTRYVDDLYYNQIYTEEMLPVIDEIFQDVITEYNEMISECSWLCEDSKNKIIEHLQAIKLVLKCEDNSLEEREYDYLGENAFETIKNQNEMWSYSLPKIYREKGKSDFYEYESFVINAVYIPWTNNIDFPVATMKYFMNEMAPEEYIPTLRFILAHEIGHSLDKNVIYPENRDAEQSNPNYVKKESLISSEEAEHIDNIYEKLKEYYSMYKVLDKYNVDGEMTANENYADLWAMRCVMRMCETKEDREKEFFAVSNFFYHDLSDEEIMYMIRTNQHTYSRVRINAMFSNTDEFYETYEINNEDGMYVKPEDRILILK